MLQLGGGAHLPLEAFERARVAGALRADELHGAGLLQQDVLGQMHLAHAAAANLADQLVLTEAPRLRHLAPQLRHLEAPKMATVDATPIQNSISATMRQKWGRYAGSTGT